jgi:23S rRNA pseudouridine2605 synthase
MRIHRLLARAGVASRRKAEALVAAGRVQVNGKRAMIGQVVDPGRDVVTIDGSRVAAAPTDATWLVLNKPAGVMTTRADPEKRRTVFDLVPDAPGLTYVGRLDFLTEGVLLLTTDGEAAHRLTHPSSGIERTYVATVQGNAMLAAKRARAGVELDDGVVRATHVEARPAGSRVWELELTIAEGRTREVRRLCEVLELEVARLVRTRFGPVRLGTLASGKTRGLTANERRAIDTIVEHGREPSDEG